MIALPEVFALPKTAPVVDAGMAPDVTVFETVESEVRSYCRTFPAVFRRAKGAHLYDETGRRWIDFFAGAGALNYGHNPEFIKQQLIAYLEDDGLTHGLDMYSSAKRTFLERFRDVVLAPRGLDYKVQFCGPTGANAVEAALKLARLVTGRTTVAGFTGGWHGMSAACLSVTGNREHRQSAGTPLPFTVMLPYPVGPYPMPGSLAYIESLLADSNSGLDLPAAFLLETLQSEGGIYAAPPEWLRGLRRICDRYGILMIVDDIQVGCGRTGSFFSFEEAGVVPDIVTLSKSIGGYGLPMSLVLMKPEIDRWKPAQHTGTFRGNQLAFVAAAAALDLWRDGRLEAEVARKAAVVRLYLEERLGGCDGIELRGRGLMIGIDLVQAAGGGETAKRAGRLAFERGLVIERCGRDDTVLKVMPPLTIEDDVLREGLEILVGAIRDALDTAGQA
jgi:diaminobutyrate-2-oxoglutarate transaminase